MIRIVRQKIFKILFCLIIGLLPFSILGQKNHLNKRLTFQFENSKLEKVLAEIERQGDFGLCYNAELINLDSLINIKVENEKVSSVLIRIFDENKFGFKSIGRHLVLFSKVTKKSPPLKIQGYIVDARSGAKIKNATVFEPKNSITASSNVDGYYEITVDNSKESIGLSFSKFGYQDSVIFVPDQKSQAQNIYLVPLPQKTSKLNPKEFNTEIQGVEERKLVQWIVPQEQINSSKNLQLFENNIGQISILPLVGTNGTLSGSISNNLSFNLFSGYSQGLNGFELGGFLNIIRENVYGTQIAGFGNIVGQSTEGAQIAGFFNYNGGDFKGGQIGGFSNILLGDINGIQVAGFANTLKGKMNGIQLAGFSNLTTANVDGLQVAGFSNVAIGDVELAQVSGFSNFSYNVKGFQIAVFMNLANGNVESIQAAGFANIARGNSNFQISGFSNIGLSKSLFQLSGFGNISFKESQYQIAGFSNICFGKIKGAQISGFFNFSRELQGLQLGFINASEKADDGLPLGFISLVKTGVHSLEYSANELFPVNISFRTGVHSFYNIFNFARSSNNYELGYGLGTRLLKRDRWNLNLEASSAMFYSNKTSRSVDGNLLKLKPLISYQLYKSLRLNIGPSLNLGIIFTDEEGILAPYLEKPLLEGNLNSSNNYQAWIGLHAGIQLF